MSTSQDNILDFLSGGGEMGQLTREKDWSKTLLGSAETWPQSLRTTLSILLRSGFPIVLFWGKDLTCFYNDAFRPSLGKEGKHPMILGMNGEEAWAEIWTTIKPWIDEVLNESKTIWNKDFLVPIYRNSRIEDVFWTFSYSPVIDESGKPAGVFVAVVETTEKVNTFKKLTESEYRFRTMPDNIPNLAWMAKADGWIYWYNKQWYEFTGTTSGQMEGWGWQSVHDPAGLSEVMEKWETSIQLGQPFEMVFPIKAADGNYRQFLTRVLPVHTDQGAVTQWFGTNTDITSQIETGQALKESEERFRTMAEASDILIAVADETSNATYFNKAWVNLTGRKVEDLLQFGWADLIHPEDKKQYLDIYFTAHKKNIWFSGEFRVLNKLGAYRWLMAQCSPLFLPNGYFSGYISSCIDITDFKLALTKVEEGEQDLHNMVLQAPIGICVMDAQSREIEIANASFIEIAGKPFGEIAGKRYRDVFTEESPNHEAAFKQVLGKGITCYCNEEKLHITRNGKTENIYVTFVFAPLKDQNEKVKKVALWVLENTRQVVARQKVEKIIAERTSELHQLNQSLRKSEEKYHLMVEEVQDYAILYLSPDGTIENWNLGAEKIKGYMAGEIIGKNFSSFYTAEDRKNGLPNILLEKARQTGRAVQQGWRVRKDRSLFWASVVINAVHNEKREVIGFSKVTHDLTDRKNADDNLKTNASELEQKNKELELVNKELQAFAYISSHDLQEPLRKIQTFTSQILEKEFDNLSENGKNKFDRMLNAAKRMQILIDDLLSYSRTNTAHRIFEKVNLLKIVQEVKGDLTEEINQKKAIIDIGQMCEARVIPFQLRQLLSNLLTNSLKFAANNRPLHIKIGSEIVEGANLGHPKLSKNQLYCHINISDNGIGFEQEYCEKIFEVFQRLHGRSEFEGTGIGLAIVKKIVENHFGVISAKGEPGKGAAFDIYIPAE